MYMVHSNTVNKYFKSTMCVDLSTVFNTIVQSLLQEYSSSPSRMCLTPFGLHLQVDDRLPVQKEAAREAGETCFTPPDHQNLFPSRLLSFLSAKVIGCNLPSLHNLYASSYPEAGRPLPPWTKFDLLSSGRRRRPIRTKPSLHKNSFSPLLLASSTWPGTPTDALH